jgi:XTP/dITP diphosphohydrolase
MQLLVATHNPAKLREIRENLAKLTSSGVGIISLKDLKITDSPEETGKTLEENAQIKAHFYAKKTDLPVLADDSGFVISALNGEPGVKAGRWLGREATDEELRNYTLERMKDFQGEERKASLQTVLYYFNPKNKKEITEYGEISGYIADKVGEKCELGFPYRAVFIVKKFNKYYDELTKEEHDNVNQRVRALKKIEPKLRKELL